MPLFFPFLLFPLFFFFPSLLSGVEIYSLLTHPQHNTHDLPLLSHSGFVFLNPDYTAVRCAAQEGLTTAFLLLLRYYLLVLFGRAASQACAGGPEKGQEDKQRAGAPLL